MDAERDELELLRAWRAGDERAGNDLVGRHAAVLYRFFGPRVPAAEVTDLAQKTFMACVEARDRVPEGVSFRAYLLGIARNKLLHHLRKREREGRALAAHQHAPAASIRSPSRHAAAAEEQRLLLKAIRELPLDLQLTVQLFYWEDLKIREVAAVLDVSEGTVKSRLHRAKAALREAIERLAESEDVMRSTQDNLERWARSLQALSYGDDD
jgi:RNA polymerase sigma-70 factor (ECF subfamily)